MKEQLPQQKNIPIAAEQELLSRYRLHNSNYPVYIPDGIIQKTEFEGVVSYIHAYENIDHRGVTEQIIDVVDISNDNALMGRGEIRFRPDSTDQYFMNKPFVGDIYTEETHTRLGLGKRRLRLMNQLTQEHYQLPLYSDTLLVTDEYDSARSNWRTLVESGLAVKFKEGKHDRFRFKTPEELAQM